MRSTIKILLGINIIVGIIYSIFGFVCSVTILIVPKTISVMAPTVKVDDYEARIIAIIMLILVVVSILSSIVAKYAIQKMDDVKNKVQLIPSILLLFLTLSFVSSLLLLFSPTDKIISKHPYFQ